MGLGEIPYELLVRGKMAGSVDCLGVPIEGLLSDVRRVSGPIRIRYSNSIHAIFTTDYAFTTKHLKPQQSSSCWPYRQRSPLSL